MSSSSGIHGTKHLLDIPRGRGDVGHWRDPFRPSEPEPPRLIVRRPGVDELVEHGRPPVGDLEARPPALGGEERDLVALAVQVGRDLPRPIIPPPLPSRAPSPPPLPPLLPHPPPSPP